MRVCAAEADLPLVKVADSLPHSKKSPDLGSDGALAEAERTQNEPGLIG